MNLDKQKGSRTVLEKIEQICRINEVKNIQNQKKIK